MLWSLEGSIHHNIIELFESLWERSAEVFCLRNEIMSIFISFSEVKKVYHINAYAQISVPAMGNRDLKFQLIEHIYHI